jgi:mRNA-degrading endonuclease RelE of RelBE toxin-antitoxin system
MVGLMKRTFVGLPFFEQEWQRLGLADEERRGLEAELLKNPAKGTLIPGTNGIRKLRRPLLGKGKSGGIRVFYYDDGELFLILFMAVIKKGEKENLSKAERNALGELVNKEIQSYRRKQ